MHEIWDDARFKGPIYLMLAFVMLTWGALLIHHGLCG